MEESSDKRESTSAVKYEYELSTDEGLRLKVRQQLKYLNFSWFDPNGERLSVGWMTSRNVQDFLSAISDLKSEGRGVYEMGGWGGDEVARLVLRQKIPQKVEIITNYPTRFTANVNTEEIDKFQSYLEGKLFSLSEGE